MFSFAWSQHEINSRKFYTPPDLVSFIIAAGVVALCPLAAAVVADAWNGLIQGVTVLRPWEASFMESMGVWARNSQQAFSKQL